ncbi:DegQ family serine endoprotease [Candidatus Manganitrophus noduliformans]|uniref:DegQ family serine endoprotease n=1 Tax=Candidatus Manganitrophus noduliformans TaxID=2606439 RepID=A0A7X6DTA2_9BACT|nr:DegQ family serine endoprotease [Candidatus Manganitrophus noduliformans]NKE72900.1 DegQ family serine endoprotease [Candidatus Manganitrophus noduliformans]
MDHLFKTVFALFFILRFISEGVPLPFLAHAVEPPRESRSLPADPPLSEPVFVEIAERMTPTVVNISTTSLHGGRDLPSLDPFSEDSFFKRFFGDSPSHLRQVQGQIGSGVIIDPNGYIVTNHHVIADAKEIRVILNDRRAFSAKVVGSDIKSDLAVVKIDARNLPSASWGDSSKLQVGEYVLAIGNPFGLMETVTLGIISAVGRANVGIADYEDFIQTDAPINPGNSGGALVNIRGELIGVNTAIFSEGGGSMGIGFAIPSNMAKPVMESLMKAGRVVRGWLGISIQEVTPELAKEFGLSKPKGVLVGDLLINGPADKAGLRRGDIILEADGEPVESVGQFRNLTASASVGSPLKLNIYREGRPQTIGVTVEENVGEAAREAPPQAEQRETSAPMDGIEVRDISPEALEERILNNSREGVVVEGVATGSGGEEAGLRQGDILVEVNRKPLKNVKEYETMISKMKKDQTVLLLVDRGGRTFFMAVRPS